MKRILRRLAAKIILGFLLAGSHGLAQSIYTPYAFTTLAGVAGSQGSVDATGSEARFSYPIAIALASTGILYVADAGSYTIRKVTLAGEVTTLAGLAGNSGSADGTGSEARFKGPSGIALDSAGNLLVADMLNDTIRKVTPGGVVTTIAGSAGLEGSGDGMRAEARFWYPACVAIDHADNIYVTDYMNNTIRKVTPEGMVTTLAGAAGQVYNSDGTGGQARFQLPRGIAVDGAGDLYVADEENHRIRKVTPAGVVTTPAGDFFGSKDGTGREAWFNLPVGVTVDTAGNVYVTEGYNSTIRRISPLLAVTTLAGWPTYSGSTDGTGSDARFSFPMGVAVDTTGNLYVADSHNHTIRKGVPTLSIFSSSPDFGFNNGQFGFSLVGPSGKSVVVEGSTNFLNWQSLWTNTFAGDLRFNDPQSGTSTNRFYRAHLP